MASALSHIVYRTAKLHQVGSLYILTYDSRKLKHNIKMFLREVQCEDVYSILLDMIRVQG